MSLLSFSLDYHQNRKNITILERKIDSVMSTHLYINYILNELRQTRIHHHHIKFIKQLINPNINAMIKHASMIAVFNLILPFFVCNFISLTNSHEVSK